MNRRRMEGHLSKFTNVVKGWQYRWFVLDPSSRVLRYYLLEDKCRGMEEMEGALVIPSEEDSQTFSIQFSTGEVYRLRATEAKERQVWVDQLRASSIRPSIRQERGSGGRSNWRARSIRLSNSRCEQFVKPSKDTSDSFASVEDILLDIDDKQEEVVELIESLPLQQNAAQASDQPTTPKCHSQNLLLLKATSAATLHCVEAAFTMLQDITLNLQSETSPRLGPSSGSIKIKNTGN
eukprot:GFUD01020248.1.p1 GENE.GFUD01020248.1~~GFUD01020248.1.p1  ORF type:complete len:236 (-),score=64.04 GFUD01020248.1:70-777(-)